LAFTFLAFAQPYDAILMTFFVLPFEYLTVLFPAESYGSGGALNFITLVKLMFGCVIVAGFLRLTVTKDERPLRNLWLTPIPVLLLLFYGMCWMSLANAKRLGPFATNMISIGSGVVAFFILINLLTTRERVIRFLKVVFFSYIFIALIGLFEAVTRKHVLKLLGFPMIERPWTQNPSVFRVAGPSGDPDYYAISVIFGLMITFAVLPLFESFLARLAVLGVTLLHFLAIVATASRGAALSMALALGLFYALARFRHKALVGVAALAVVGASFAAFSLGVSSSSARRLLGGDTSSWDQRWGWIQMCYAMMLDAPVRGLGSGQFVVFYNSYKRHYPVPRLPESAQNTYAQLAAQNGIRLRSYTWRRTSSFGSCSTGSCGDAGSRAGARGHQFLRARGVILVLLPDVGPRRDGDQLGDLRRRGRALGAPTAGGPQGRGVGVAPPTRHGLMPFADWIAAWKAWLKGSRTWGSTRSPRSNGISTRQSSSTKSSRKRTFPTSGSQPK
jgi:O-antigen ligase